MCENRVLASRSHRSWSDRPLQGSTSVLEWHRSSPSSPGGSAPGWSNECLTEWWFETGCPERCLSHLRETRRKPWHQYQPCLGFSHPLVKVRLCGRSKVATWPRREEVTHLRELRYPPVRTPDSHAGRSRQRGWRRPGGWQETERGSESKCQSRPNQTPDSPLTGDHRSNVNLRLKDTHAAAAAGSLTLVGSK